MTRRLRPIPPLIAQLIAERKRRGLTYEALATMIGMSGPGLRAYEVGLARPSFDTLMAWCDCLGMTIEISAVTRVAPVQRDYLFAVA